MTPDLSQYLDYVAWLKRDTELRLSMDAVAKRLAAKTARNREVRQAWEAERTECVGRLEPPPPEPAYPEDGTPEQSLMAHLRQEQSRHHVEERRRVLASIAADLESEYQETLPRLAEAVRSTTVGDLPERLIEARAWHRVLQEARRAVETADPNARQADGPSARMRAWINLPDLLDLAEGVDLCAARPPAKVSETEPTSIEFDPLDNGGVRIGLQPPRVFGNAPAVQRAPVGRPGEI